MSAPPASAGVSLLLDTIKSLEKRSSCLLEMARFVREVHDFRDLLGRLLSKSMELVGADAGAIALADKDTGEFTFVNVHYASLPPMEAEKKEKMLQLVRLKLADGVLGQVYASGEPQSVPDLSGHAAFRKDVADTVSYEVRNLMAVPLSIDGEKLGVVEFLNKIPEGAFTPLDVDLASAMGSQIALVVEAHRLRESSGGGAASAADEASRVAAEKEDMERRLKEERERLSTEKEGLESRLKEMESRVAGAEESLRKEADAARAEAGGLKTELEVLRRSLAEAEKKAEAAAADARKAAEERDAARKEAASIKQESSALRAAAAEAEKSAAETQKSVRESAKGWEAARAEASRAEEKIRNLTQDLETAFRSQEKAQRQIDELTRALEEKKKDVRPQEHRTALMKAFSAVSSNQPTEVVLDIILTAVTTLLDAEAASLLLTDEETGRLYFAAATGQRKDPLRRVLLKEGEGIAGWVAKNGRILNIPDVARDPRFSDQADKSADFRTRSILAVPLFSDSQLLGVAEAVNKKGDGFFTDEDAEVLISMSLYSAMVIRKARIYWEMNELFLSTVRTLADAMEDKGPGGKGRAERVRRLTLALAREASYPTAQERDLEIAALLHDVGKIIVPESVLHKPEGLTEEEARLLTRAPVVAAEILSPAKPLKNVVPLVRHVHERWDGQGHPDKLKGADIPQGSRFIAVAATYEAMTADRTYRRRLPEEVAVKEVQTLRGVSLDPDAVDALTRLYRKGKLKDIFK